MKAKVKPCPCGGGKARRIESGEEVPMAIVNDDGTLQCVECGLTLECNTEAFRYLHKALLHDVRDLILNHNGLGVAISDMRNQLDHIFKSTGLNLPNKDYEYLGHKTTKEGNT